MSSFHSTENPLLVAEYSKGQRCGQILRAYLTLPCLPKEAVWAEVMKLKAKVATLHDPAVRTAMKEFHSNYIVAFWLRKIGPQRFSVFRFAHKTNNAMEGLHSSMGCHMSKHPLFLNFFLNLIHYHLCQTNIVLRQLQNGEDVSVKRKKSDLQREE
ncbi:MAG: hypothetical protein Q8O19_04605 [Rectinemataceae bacterium]|nr:hypothetical protein [Rectinemataceae bacterium]